MDIKINSKNLLNTVILNIIIIELKHLMLLWAGGDLVKDMISRIIEMDKTARDLTQRAQKDKINLENEIKFKKDEIRNEYLERARKRLAINEKTERSLAEEQKLKIIENYKNISRNIDDLYNKNCDVWVDSIVKNVLGE